MKVRIDEIPAEGLTVDVEEDGNRLFENETELRFEKKVFAHLIMRCVGPNVVISGKVRAEVLLLCSRCLEKFSFDAGKDFSLEYRPLSEISEGGDIQLSAGEMDVQYFSGAEIDLDGVIEGLIAEKIPFKPLCSESCSGLCPQCGRNLNRSACGCVIEAVDPRFAKLKDLLKKESPSSK